MPSNTSPQAGSTSAVGNGREGLWISSGGATQGFAFVTPTDQYLSFIPPSATGTGFGALFDGAWDAAGSNWSFAAGSTFHAGTSSGPVWGGLYGSGTVTPLSQLQGEYRLLSPGATPTAFSMDYSVANALAVSAGDIVATWSNGGVTIGIDATGALSGSAQGGSVGSCAMSGSAAAHEPGTSKNFYTVSITLGDVTPNSCLLDKTHGAYQGYGAITLANTGTSESPFLVRSFTLLVRVSSGSSWFAMDVARQ
jgi:hypothetical protein